MSISYEKKLHQQNHLLRWNGDIAESLLLIAIEGNESLSSPFRYDVRSLTNFSEAQLIRWHGEAVSCRIGDGGRELPQRFVHGVVTRIQHKQRTQDEAECILTLEPSLSMLGMGRVMRIWQNISVPDLVETLLTEQGISHFVMELYNSYPVREYCVQYRESAIDFIQRLLGEEGIYYFFRHSESGHTLVMADHPSAHSSIRGETLNWDHQGRILDGGNIDGWISTATLLPKNVVLQGVNMLQAAVTEEQQNANGLTIDTVTFTDITPQGDRKFISREAKKWIAAREANIRTIDATVNAHWLSSGETFTLTNHPSGDQLSLIKSLTFEAVNNFDNNTSTYRCQLQALNHNQPWAPPYPSRPEITGVLTATVVGPSSEDIYTDEYGRIKIQFPWGQGRTHDDTSACWVQMSQPWVGGQFGAQFIHRVGTVVLVSFVQGHPDFPIVIGAIYNGENSPPFALPASKNECGFVTRSSPQGNIGDGHRLSFNDKKGEELLTIMSQKDLSLIVKNDAIATITANRRTELLRGNDHLLLKQGDVDIILEKGNWQQNITGDASIKLTGGNYSLEATGGCIKTDEALTLESTMSIELTVGDSKIKLSADGISLNGKKIQIEGNDSAVLNSKETTVSGTTQTIIDGQLILIG